MHSYGATAMSEPLVYAVMLTKDRPELARRAIKCFRAQTYANRNLVILNTGSQNIGWDYKGLDIVIMDDVVGVGYHFATQIAKHRFDVRKDMGPGSIMELNRSRGCADMTIGYLRNVVNAVAIPMADAEIIIHWDDDDWSHPNRIAEQVEFLQRSKADVVGYNELLFWRTEKRLAQEPGRVTVDCYGTEQAWLYTRRHGNYCPGTSLCYWRKTWEAHPFKDAPSNSMAGCEYQHWFQGALKVGRMSSLIVDLREDEVKLLMIARIHGGNSMSYDLEDTIARGSTEWKRVPDWDDKVREILA